MPLHYPAGKHKGEKGIALLEVIVSLALVGIVGVLFLGSAASSAHARYQADERTSAKVLAESLMDTIKKTTYKASYTDDVVIPEEFTGFNATVTATGFANGNIQKISILIKHEDKEVLTLESFKVKRNDETET